jgi:hypothetical protein
VIPRPAPPGSATGRALRWILGLQVAIALVMMGGDLLGALPASLQRDSAAPPPDTPVSPGDQIRRFAPSRLMTDTPAGPGFPASDGPVPRRLAWDSAEIDGAPGLRLTGTIAPGDAARLAEHLDGLDPAPATVALHSPGGSVTDALAIGRRLRADGIATRVDPDAACLSACPYMLAGGTERRVSRTATVGVHQHYFGKSTVLPAFLAVSDIQRGQAEVLAYLDAMGVDPVLLAKAMQTPPDDIYILVPEELEAFALATELTD